MTFLSAGPRLSCRPFYYVDLFYFPSVPSRVPRLSGRLFYYFILPPSVPSPSVFSFTSPSHFSFFVPRFVTVLIVSTTEPQPQHHHQEILPSLCRLSADSARCTCCCCCFRTSCGRLQQQQQNDQYYGQCSKDRL